MTGQQNIVEFPTGAVREGKDGKGDYALLPPFAIHQLAKLFQDNSERIGARNWESGLPLSSYVDSGFRHMNQYMMFKDDENHLLRWAWNALCAVDTVERVRAGLLPAELLDCGAYTKLYIDTPIVCDGCEDCGEVEVYFMDSDFIDPLYCAFNSPDCDERPCPDCLLTIVPMGER
jgi:hypothetical protein